MTYLIVGMIIGLFGLGLMRSEYDIAGMILMIIGLAVVFKGRRKLDEKK